MKDIILDSMSELIASMDVNFNFTYFNKTYHSEFKKIFGPDLKIGDNILKKLSHLPKDQKKVEDIWGRAIRGEEFIVIQTLGDTNRERNTYEISYSSVKDDKGEITGAMHIVRDVTIRENLRQKAEQSMMAKQRFLSSISHELRTPLNSILGFSQLISYDKEKKNSELYSKSILRSGKHLLGLINDTLDYNKIQEGMLSVSPEVINPYELLVDIVEDMKNYALENDVKLYMNCDEHKDINIIADNQRYKQIIFNLVSNAIKYNKKNGSVEIKSKNENGMLIVEICDTGIGIENSDICKLWEPFDRLSNEATSIQGTGLGLTITKMLADMMNGVLDVKSEKGKGSVFSIGFISTTKTPVNIAKEYIHTKDDIFEEYTGKVIYIEDNTFNVVLMTNIMEFNFPKVQYEYSYDGHNAMKKICETDPDVILLDINLDGCNGIDILKNIRKNNKFSTKKVIMISADVTENIQKKCIQNGADAYLSKPIIIPAFLRTISPFLKKSDE